MNWNITEHRDGFRAQKTGGLTAHIRRVCLWAEFMPGRGTGYDVNYKGLTIARIYFENKGATVKTLAMAGAFPEISDLDLVEIALRVNQLRSAAAAALN